MDFLVNFFNLFFKWRQTTNGTRDWRISQITRTQTQRQRATETEQKEIQSVVRLGWFVMRRHHPSSERENTHRISTIWRALPTMTETYPQRRRERSNCWKAEPN